MSGGKCGGETVKEEKARTGVGPGKYEDGRWRRKKGLRLCMTAGAYWEAEVIVFVFHNAAITSSFVSDTSPSWEV
jgi:hypothetical protein